MLISDPCVVSLTWTLADAQDTTLDELSDPVAFFYGGDDLLPKLEEALAGQAVGFKCELHLEPEHGFGDYDPQLVCFEARSLFPEHLEQGMQFDGLPEGAVTKDMPPALIYTVTEIYPEHVVLDGNHPLAGMALNLTVTVRAVRAATDDEVAAKSVDEGAVSLLSPVPTSRQLH
ncbi:MAG: peptidylprolyl isomerase [Burkholderiales bacterium RIFCSPHIGHO2_12_FULL_69_20]|nr:MAG: peptidylprolyl isomerase [Burkholderiales bacterium RIFCSPHIGHO2_12_FULL_69_20]